MQRIARYFSIAFIALALSGCSGTTRQSDSAGAVCTESRTLVDQPGAVSVDMENNPALPPFIASRVYAPSEITAKVGQVIVFRNGDPDEQHTAELNSGACGTDYLDFQKRDTLVFKVAGKYLFNCFTRGTAMAGWARRRFRAIAAATIALTLSGCSPSVAPAPSSAPHSAGVSQAPAGPGGCGTVTIAMNPWVGYQADAAVVGYLLQHELGCTVVKRQFDDEASWQLLASRGIDVILEKWDHEDLASKYITVDKVAQDAGPTGNEGVIGWFAPKFFVDANPDILKAKTDPSILNKFADQFRTAQSGAKGQILDGEPGFATLDRAMINGFGLDYQVVYSGSEEASYQAIQTAIDTKTPILAYYVTPNWFSTKVDLVHIELPPYTPGCNTDPAKVACDYPVYHLSKVVSTKFATSGSPAFELIKRFSWTNADQDAVAASIVDGHMSDDDAARKWLDANPSVWRAWLP